MNRCTAVSCRYGACVRERHHAGPHTNGGDEDWYETYPEPAPPPSERCGRVYLSIITGLPYDDKPCVRPAGHAGDHEDAEGGTW